MAELIRDKAKDIKRIQFNEITAKAVKEALAHPRELNGHLFDAQQARRVLDRLVGYKISPLLWKSIKRGISAGRVQSVALRLIVEREEAREVFKPEEYWLFKALLAADVPPPFKAELAKVGGKKAVISNAAQAKDIEDAMIGSRTKREQVYAALRKQGVPDAELAAVCCPIGLSIEAETPQQIAVSIVAELLAARAGTLVRLRFDD